MTLPAAGASVGTMNTSAWRVCALALAIPLLANAEVRPADLVGWWSAKPRWGDESSRVAMRFVERKALAEA